MISKLKYIIKEEIRKYLKEIRVNNPHWKNLQAKIMQANFMDRNILKFIYNGKIFFGYEDLNSNNVFLLFLPNQLELANEIELNLKKSNHSYEKQENPNIIKIKISKRLININKRLPK